MTPALEYRPNTYYRLTWKEQLTQWDKTGNWINWKLFMNQTKQTWLYLKQQFTLLGEINKVGFLELRDYALFKIKTIYLQIGRCVCMSECVCVCVCVWERVCVCECACVPVCICVRASECEWVCACLCVWARVNVCVCEWVSVCAWVRVCVCVWEREREKKRESINILTCGNISWNSTL